MFKNYLKIAFRNMARHKTFFIINILGLAVGMACTVLILMWVLDELSYDSFHKNGDNIYRINNELKLGSTESDMPLSPDMMGPCLKQDFPQIKEFTRIYSFDQIKLIKRGSAFIKEVGVYYADSTFFKVFSFPAIAGNLETALNEPNSIVITESTAKKYFGSSDALGKIITMDDNKNAAYKVTAVIMDIPQNSHFTFNFLLPMCNLNYRWGNYSSSNFFTYLQLKDGIDYISFEKNLQQYIVKYLWPFIQKITDIKSMSDFERAGNRIKYTLIPMKKIHLYSNRQNELGVNGNIQYVYILAIIALFILLIASINFMNLTTARSANRAREVGIRKVLGTERKNLIVQFLTESVLLAYLAIIAAIGFVYLFLPLFNSISGKKMLFTVFMSPVGLMLIIALPFIVGIIAGIYPALFLSRFKPVIVLKGRLLSGKNGGSLRGALVVFQFAASIVLIIATLIINRQLDYVQNKYLGYNKDQVLIINDTYALKENVDAFKNEMLQIPGVQQATLTGFLPIPSARSNTTYFKDAAFDSKGTFNMQRWQIDYDYIKFMGMQIIAGRNFSREFGTDTSAVIINEEAAKQLGYNNPIGENIYTLSISNLQNRVSYKIIGVVKNFHYESLKQQIGPLCFLLGKNKGACSFRVDAANITGILKKAEDIWKGLAPDMPFNYRFMDESFTKQYNAERNIGMTALASSVFAVLVACLGLLGLSIFMAQQKTKEIGIRKTLGASIPVILFLFSKEFLKWLVIANIIAWPVAYYFMNKWLQNFAYRTELSLWIFVSSGGIALVIALTTLSIQAIKAAIANPIKALRYE
jgi:putative ABC transport system permease protein